jgi:UDP:flavonoid glycosyltransferase YjiC (YdhE family)
VVTRDAARLEQITLEAIRLSGQRAILQAGWAGVGKAATSSRSLLIVGGVPHDALFSRVAAVVHHGGAGTTAAGLRAGIPSLITPFNADQPFWAYRVALLGVGPQPIPAQRLSAPKLAEAIRQAATDETMRAKAAALGEKIRAEDGVGEAVRIIKGYLG